MVNKQTGQTILEVLVALSAGIIILTAITGVVLRSLDQSAVIRSKAVQYAQEGMEIVRGTGGFAAGETFCLGQDNQLIPGDCSLVSSDVYKREVTIEQKDCGTLQKVTVSVSWRSVKCTDQSYCERVPLSTCL
jgi:Tfp pilus assembly protein PilV